MIRYEGLDEVEEYEGGTLFNLLSGEPALANKLNEVIRVVNMLLKLKNAEVSKQKGE